LPQHPRRVQPFNNDPAVGFSQSCRQDVEVMGTDIIDPAMQPGNLGGALTVPPRARGATRTCPAQLPQLTQRGVERARVLDLFDHDTLSGGHCGQTPHPDIDTNPRTR
jgi:hypothetical protein